MPAPVLHQPVVETLGQEITDGALAPGQVLRVEDLIARFDLSRTVAREAVRVLETMGMVAVKRRVGTVVQPRSEWNVMDPRVIRWRLSGVHRAEEVDHLMQVRAGVEPIAARLCATTAPPGVGPRLRELADQMHALGTAGRGITPEFLRADVEFHRLVVTSSGNDHMAAFSTVLTTLLTERNRLGMLGAFPDPRAMAAHVAMAEAITNRQPTPAEHACRSLVHVVHAEVLAPSRPVARTG